jgi:hypothetical protein
MATIGQENLETVMIDFFGALRRGDFEAAAGLLDPDVRWQGLREEWVCHGREEVIEGEVGVPDDVAGCAEAAGRVVGEPAAGEAGAVPEADDARVVEHVRVPGAARVTGEHRQPDRVHGQLRVRVGVEDVRADPTGPERADTSGGRDEHYQPRLAGAVLNSERRLADVAQVGELPRPGQTASRRTRRGRRLLRCGVLGAAARRRYKGLAGEADAEADDRVVGDGGRVAETQARPVVEVAAGGEQEQAGHAEGAAGVLSTRCPVGARA